MKKLICIIGTHRNKMYQMGGFKRYKCKYCGKPSSKKAIAKQIQLGNELQ